MTYYSLAVSFYSHDFLKQKYLKNDLYTLKIRKITAHTRAVTTEIVGPRGLSKAGFMLTIKPIDTPVIPSTEENDDNIKAERCAIDSYNNLMKQTRDKDMVTYNIALTILEQKIEHEEDLQSLLEDLDLLVSRGLK